MFITSRPVSCGLAVLTVRLPFSPGGGEVALLGLAATSDTWGVVRLVNRSEVAANLSLSARNLRNATLASVGDLNKVGLYAGLICPLVQ